MRRPLVIALIAVAALAIGFLTACVVISLITSPGAPTPRPTPLPTLVRSPTPTPRPTVTPTRVPTPAGLPTNAALGGAWTRPADGMVMVRVPAGTFPMGSPPGEPWTQEDEVPPHAVTLRAFWLDRTEVTNGQYARCVVAGACESPFAARQSTQEGHYGDPRYDAYPVVNVSWPMAQAYCNWAGAYLPTEAQWEYAARGPDGLLFPWGNSAPDGTRLNFAREVGEPRPVGSYELGASWCGALDMAGNVWEWTADWYRIYTETAQVDPVGPPQGIGHVLRGGSWYDGADFVRAANRYVIREAYRDYYTSTGYGGQIGFRCAVGP